jgi:hypothetical protein
MSEAADAVDGDEVARAGATVAKSVESRDAGAEQGSGLDRVKLVRHMRDSSRASTDLVLRRRAAASKDDSS